MVGMLQRGIYAAFYNGPEIRCNNPYIRTWNRVVFADVPHVRYVEPVPISVQSISDCDPLIPDDVLEIKEVSLQLFDWEGISFEQAMPGICEMLWQREGMAGPHPNWPPARRQSGQGTRTQDGTESASRAGRTNEQGEQLLCIFCDKPARIRAEGFAPECDVCFEKEPSGEILIPA